ALALTLSQNFEVVLLDIKMPGISGMDILRQIHGDRPETSIIMVTAVGDVETAVEAMKIGAVDYVLKPFNLGDILVRVDKARERWYLALRVKDYQKNLEEKVTQQTKELRDMMVHTINTMFREEVTSQTSGDHGKKRNGPGVDIKELGAKIHRRLSGIG
ncbi:MAG: response regulator, partial [Chloroflexi bacterium]|nr:response regulator [Chloroflexota bacterium]